MPAKTLNLLQKATLLFSLIQYKHRFDHLKLRDGKLYSCSWKEDYHNGDIDNYQEKEIKQHFPRLASIVEKLEEQYIEEEESRQEIARHTSILDKLYSRESQLPPRISDSVRVKVAKSRRQRR